jgi:hypothetical protein
MNESFFASSGSFATAPAVLATLVASVALLGLRAWFSTNESVISRRVAILLNGAITVLVVLFAFLVIVRFKTLA